MLRRESGEEELDEHIDMTPMVDVVFQLMTFMLLSSQMSGGEVVDVPAAVHGIGVEKDASAIVIVLPPSEINARPRILLGDTPGAPEATDDNSLKRYLSDNVSAGKARVIVQADGQVEHGEVLRIASVVSEVEGTSLHIAVQEPPK